MFDSFVTRTDPEAGRRSAASMAMTAGAVAGFVGGVIAWTSIRTVDPATPAPVPVEMVFLNQPPPEEEPPPALPDVPKAPNPTPATGGEAAAPPDPSVTPTLAPMPADAPIVDALPPGNPGTPGGTGDEGGDPRGKPGGGGGGGNGIRYIPHDQLTVRKHVMPEYPAAAAALGLGQQRCTVSVSIDAEGVPTEVSVSGCPLPFHEETRQALLRWRWNPPKVGGAKVAARTTVAVVYKLENGRLTDP